MNEKKNKMKKWFEENKNEIKTEALKITYYAVGLGIGYFVGDKICSYQNAAGMQKLHEMGIFKFFDPSTGTEIDVNKAVEVAKEMLKK